MDLEDLLKTYSDALYEQGSPVSLGCDVAEVPAMISKCRELSTKKYSVISNWVIWNIDYDATARQQISDGGLKPSVLYATNLIDDEAGRAFRCVRSTLLKQIHHNCIFESMNTFYILVGSGSERTVSAEFIQSLSFC